MPVVELSTTFVRQVACAPGQRKTDYFDSQQRGFLLEVSQSGNKTFYQRYTDDRGRVRQYKIGNGVALTVRQARQRARTLLAQAILGDDPQKARRDARRIPTLQSFAHEKYLPFVRTYKTTWKTDETILRTHILPRFGNSFLDQITTEAIASMVTVMQSDGYANGTITRVIVIIRYMFNLARKWGVPGALKNPAANLNAGPLNQRSRFLTEEETQHLVYALQSDVNQVAARAILLLLLTGARRNEITQARWEYVDWPNETLLVPRSKSGKPRVISLNESALALLKATPREPDNPYIFPSGFTGRPSPSLFFPWDRIRKRAGLEDVRLHDLRHSFASFLVNRGISLYVVQGLLGHANARTTQRYAHLKGETLKAAAGTIDAVVRVPETGKLDEVSVNHIR